MDRLFFAMGAIVALLSVAIGAFGAHALEPRPDPKALASFQTAAPLPIYHPPPLLFSAWAATRWPGTPVKVAGWAFVSGIVLFCGSLYGLSLGSPRAFGAVAPIGGLSFMIGWGCLAAAVILSRN